MSTSLLDSALKGAWRRENFVGQVVHRGWCQSARPHGGNLLDEGSSLGYADDDTGIWCLWIREDERQASKVTVESEADRIAQAEFELQFVQLPRDEKKKIIEQARTAIRLRTEPRTRIVQVVSSGAWAWVGRRAAVGARDVDYRPLLWTVFGRCVADRVLWNLEDEHEGRGWQALSLAALMAFLETEGGLLDVDVSLTDVQLKGGIVQGRTSGSSEEIRHVVEALQAADPNIEVRSLTFQVDTAGESTELQLDRYGVFRAVPPRSGGGLLHERLRRRFSDVFEASSRLREVLDVHYERISEEA